MKNDLQKREVVLPFKAIDPGLHFLIGSDNLFVEFFLPFLREFPVGGGPVGPKLKRFKEGPRRLIQGRFFEDR